MGSERAGSCGRGLSERRRKGRKNTQADLTFTSEERGGGRGEEGERERGRVVKREIEGERREEEGGL